MQSSGEEKPRSEGRHRYAFRRGLYAVGVSPQISGHKTPDGLMILALIQSAPGVSSGNPWHYHS
jgi:hypothetical protein